MPTNDMEFTIVSGPTLSWSARIVLLLTFGFLFAGYPIARRSLNPLAVLTLPFFWSAAGVFLGLARVAEAMSLVGGGRAATAAGIAEAQVFLVLAFSEICFLTLVVAWRGASSAASNGRRKILAAIAGLVVIFGAADYLLSTALLGSKTAAHFQYSSALVLAGAAALGLLALSVLTVRWWSRPGVPAERASALVLAVISFAFAVASSKVVGLLERIAMRRSAG